MAEHKTQTEAPTDGPLTDHAEAARLLRLIAGDGPVTFQTFDDGENQKRSKLVRMMHGRFGQFGVRLDSLNSDGAGVFFMVNEGTGEGRKARDVTKVRAVFADLDGAPLEPVLRCPLSPHAVVETSPGKFHAYWCVDGLPLELFKPVQKTIARRFQADPKVHDLCRVARLPGFYHRKRPESPFLSKLVLLTPGKRYSLEQLTAAFPPAEMPAANSGAEKPARPRYRLGDGIPVGERNSRLFAFASNMRDRCIPQPHVLNRLQKVNAVECHVPLCATEVDAIVSSAFATPTDAAPRTPLQLMLSPKVRALSHGAFRMLQHAVYQAQTVRNGEIEIDPAHLADCMNPKSGYAYRRELIEAGLIEAVRAATYNELGRECALFRITGYPESWGPS